MLWEAVTMALNIRPMTSADKTAIMHILRATPEFKPAEVVVAEELLDWHLQDPVGSGYHVLVAEAGGSVSGYVCYGPTPLTEGTWDVYWIAVSREGRGRGVGSALSGAAEGKIREASGRLVIVETSSKPEYENTRRFYVSKGYEEAGRIGDFYAPGDDLVIFKKQLSCSIAPAAGEAACCCLNEPQSTCAQ